jgi:hypothetical protein
MKENVRFLKGRLRGHRSESKQKLKVASERQATTRRSCVEERLRALEECGVDSGGKHTQTIKKLLVISAASEIPPSPYSFIPPSLIIIIIIIIIIIVIIVISVTLPLKKE